MPNTSMASLESIGLFAVWQFRAAVSLPAPPTKHSRFRRHHFPAMPKIPGNRSGLSSLLIQQRGSVMWGFLINLIYHRFCRTSLLGMRKHYLAR
jgi:hypothetical protein